jgi:wyosine [tRNA(Phe)-imidazoG37] synthetase (radical SAM superfamily)
MNGSSFRYLYGPGPSRRLGRSLGIDLVPFKTCTYDCVYCQLGRTTNKTLERKKYVAVTASFIYIALADLVPGRRATGGLRSLAWELPLIALGIGTIVALRP